MLKSIIPDFLVNLSSVLLGIPVFKMKQFWWLVNKCKITNLYFRIINISNSTHFLSAPEWMKFMSLIFGYRPIVTICLTLYLDTFLRPFKIKQISISSPWVCTGSLQKAPMLKIFFTIYKFISWFSFAIDSKM